MKTKIINGTDREITLKEGNAGTQRFLCTLAKKGDPKNSIVMELDVNATYKEYHFFEIPSTTAVIVLSSDSLAEYKDITIEEISNQVFVWKGTPRKPEKTTGEMVKPTSSGGRFGWFRSMFTWKPSPSNDGSPL